MDIKIIDKKKNSLMKRTEVFCDISHDGESTPKRDDVRKNVAGQMNAKEDKVVLVSIKSDYAGGSRAVLHVYSSKKDMMSNEKKYLLLRSKIIKPEKKEEEPKTESKPAKTESKSEEKKDGKEKKGSEDKGKEGKEKKADK